MSSSTSVSPQKERAPLPATLRLSYERGRMWAAFPWMLGAALLALVAYLSKQQGHLSMDSIGLLCGGAGLAVAIGVMRWAGQSWNHVARLGLLLGLIPYLAALSAPYLGHTCPVGGCTSLCLPLCSAAGLSAGWLAVRPIVKHKLSIGYGLATITIILAVGTLACSCIGVTSILGAGVGIGSLAHTAWVRRHQS